jgi:hypothetical protein
MNYKTLFLTIGLVLLSFGIVNAACTNPSGSSIKILGVQWGNSTHVVSAGPGSRDIPLTVSMESFGNDCALSNIEGTLETYGGVSNFNGSIYSKYFIENANAYSIFNMVFYLNLARNLSVGQNTTLSYPIYIAWNYTGNSTERYTQELNVSLPLKGSPSLVFSIPYSTLIAGQTNNVTVQVSNIGTGYAYDINLPLTSSPVINLIRQAGTISSLAPGSDVNTTFLAYVPPTLKGEEVTLNLNPHYINPYGYNSTNSSTIELYVLQNQGSVNISSNMQSLFSGEVNTANIIITNGADSAMTNLSVSLTPSSSLSIIGSDGYVPIQRINPHSSATIPLQLYPSASGTVASLGVSLSYPGGNITRTISFLTPGYINLSEVSSTVLPAAPQKGEIFTITSTLDNLGSETAYAVTVTPEPPKGINIVGQNSSFIGDVASDTPTSVTLSFTAVQSLNPGTYSIPVKLSYVNNINQRLNQTLYYSVDIAQGSVQNRTLPQSGTAVRTQGGEGLFVAFVIVVIILIAVYLYIRNQGKKEAKKAKVSK